MQKFLFVGYEMVISFMQKQSFISFMTNNQSYTHSTVFENEFRNDFKNFNISLQFMLCAYILKKNLSYR